MIAQAAASKGVKEDRPLAGVLALQRADHRVALADPEELLAVVVERHDARRLRHRRLRHRRLRHGPRLIAATRALDLGENCTVQFSGGGGG
jgi:hypothetical protein